MCTTTIRINAALKARLVAAAERAGTTPHAFILEVIERTVEQDEQENAFHKLADARWARLLATGQTVTWDNAKSHVAARDGCEPPSNPTVRKRKGA